MTKISESFSLTSSIRENDV